MVTKTRKKKRSKLEVLDRQTGARLRKEEAKQARLNRKRLREFTAISGTKKKTKWYY